MKKNTAILLLLLAFCGCTKEQNTPVADPNLVVFDIKLLGRNEVPETISPAEGTFKGSFNKTTKIFSYTLTYTGMTATAAHFHKGAATATGPVVINIATAAFGSPLVAQTAALNLQQELDLVGGSWYVNVHSALYPNGEIRGQLVKK
jgi:CHRD domain